MTKKLLEFARIALVLFCRQRDRFYAAFVFALANKHGEGPVVVVQVVRSLIELPERTLVSRGALAPQVELRIARSSEQVKQRADFEAELRRMAHLAVALDCVLVAAAASFSGDVAGVDQVSNDPLGGSFGDSDPDGDFSEPDRGVLGDAEEHLGVVGHEPPRMLCLFSS